MVLGLQMIFIKTHTFIFVIVGLFEITTLGSPVHTQSYPKAFELPRTDIVYLISNNIAIARPLTNLKEDSKDLQEGQLSRGFYNQPFFTPESNLPNNDDSNPSEVQKAVCTVTAGDVKASAEAVTTKVLKGVCGSTEMLSAFSNLEAKLNKELEDIRKILVLILQQQQQQHHQQNRIVNDDDDHEQISSENSSISSIFSTTPATFIKLQPIPHENKHNDNEGHKNYEITPKVKSLQIKKDIRSNMSLPAEAPVREQEVSMFNNTLLTDKDIKVFTYYWRMDNFTTKLKNEKNISVESPVFSIKGKTFKIKAYFQHLHRDFLFLQLEDLSSSTHVNFGNSIILDTGGIFKKIESNSFKYKISILDQNKKRSKDLVSQEFHNYEKGFLVPNTALLDSSFIKDDALLIQIFLYL